MTTAVYQIIGWLMERVACLIGRRVGRTSTSTFSDVTAASAPNPERIRL